MKIVHLFLIAILFLILTDIVLAQGEYLVNEQSGIGASSNFVTNKFISAYGVSLGLCYKRIVDFNLSFGAYENQSPKQVTDRSVTSSITYYPIKQNINNKRFTVGITGAYEHIKPVGHDSESEPKNIVSLGFVVARQIVNSEKFVLQPMVGVSLAKGTSFTIVNQLSIAIGGRFGDSYTIVINPSVSFQSPNQVYGASFIIVI